MLPEQCEMMICGRPDTAPLAYPCSMTRGDDAQIMPAENAYCCLGVNDALCDYGIINMGENPDNELIPKQRKE